MPIILLMIFPVLFLIVGIRYLWHRYISIQTLEGFTHQEKIALSRQIGALVMLLPYALITVFSFTFKVTFALQEFTFVDAVIGSYHFKIVNFLIGYVFFGYIALSSIRERVSIINRGSRPFKGNSAILNGILLFILMSFIGVFYLT